MASGTRSWGRPDDNAVTALEGRSRGVRSLVAMDGRLSGVGVTGPEGSESVQTLT
jgi:hypothetical protein